eukprot:scaffold85566_cov31-Tisochrysis_lutea.AAC.5
MNSSKSSGPTGQQRSFCSPTSYMAGSQGTAARAVSARGRCASSAGSQLRSLLLSHTARSASNHPR